MSPRTNHYYNWTVGAGCVRTGALRRCTQSWLSEILKTRMQTYLYLFRKYMQGRCCAKTLGQAL